MKNIIYNSLQKLLLIIFVISINFASLIAQENSKLQVIVMFDKNLITLPEGKTEADINQLIIKSPEVKEIFSKYNLRFIKKAFPLFSSSDTLSIARSGEQVKLSDLSNIFLFDFTNANSLSGFISEIKETPGIIYAEPNYHDYRAHGFPNDPFYENGDLWGLYNYGQSGGTADADIDAPEAWQITTGSNVLIGIIDDGVDAGHEDLIGKVDGDAGVYGGNNNWHFRHGTHVSGIAAAIGNNTKGIAGVNWAATINSQRIENGSDIDFYNGIMSAVYAGSKILNNSWGGYSYSTTIRIAFANAYKLNVVSVASMGNDNTSSVSYPAGYGQGIISVGATNRNDVRWTWNSYQGSNYGNHIDVVAPGDQIWSSIPFTNQYASWTGTSMAAPFVSGIASILKGYNPNLYNDDIEQIIRISADDKGPVGWDQEYGTGRVNTYNALNLLRAPYQLSQLSASGGSDVSHTGTYTTVIYGASGLADGVYIVERHEVRKNVSFSPRTNINVWGRGVGTTGWSAANPNFTMGYCDVVPGTVTSTSATLRTYVYKVWSISGQYLGYYPTSPSNVNFNYTVHGKPVPLTATMSGPSYLSSGQSGTFIVTATGGTPPYTYSWSYYIYCRDQDEVEFSVNKEPIVPEAPVCGYWIPISNTTNTVTKTSDGRSFQMKCLVTDANNTTYTVTKYVQGNLSKIALPDSSLTNNSLVELKTELLDNYPNPFNPTTQINYSIKESGLVQLKVYDILGKEVAALVNEIKEAGHHTVNFDASELPSGVYIYQLTTPGFIQARKMILTK